MNRLKTRLAGWQDSALIRRWHGLPPRDRLALGLLSLFLLLVLLYLGLWRPAVQGAQSAREFYQQERELNAYMTRRAPQARVAQAAPQTDSVDPARLQSFVTASATEHGLNIERLDNDGSGGLQVGLQAAPFVELLGWLAKLEQQGVRIEEAGLDRAEPGRVSARLVLRAGT
jgi:general secretion pathway protein M